MLADDPATLYVSAPVSYLMFHGAYDTPKFRFCSPHRRPPPMGGFHLMPYPCKQGMKPTLSLLKSHSAFALHSCPLLLSPRQIHINTPLNKSVFFSSFHCLVADVKIQYGDDTVTPSSKIVSGSISTHLRSLRPPATSKASVPFITVIVDKNVLRSRNGRKTGPQSGLRRYAISKRLT